MGDLTYQCNDSFGICDYRIRGVLVTIYDDNSPRYNGCSIFCFARSLMLTNKEMPAVLVISLARSAVRRAHFANTNPLLHFQFVDAVDGATLSPAQQNASWLFAEKLPYTSGGIGCALSHLSLWDLAISRNEPLTIAEDDAYFRADFVEKSAQILAQLPADWDIMLWGWNFDSVLIVDHVPPLAQTAMVFSQAQLQQSVESFQQGTGQVNVFKLFHAFGSMAYTISPQGAARLKAACFPLRSFQLHVPLINNLVGNTGIDTAMNSVYGQMDAYVCFPPLVVSKNDRQTSTVQVAPSN